MEIARQTNSIGQRPTTHSVQQLSTLKHTPDKSNPVGLVLERLEKVRSSGDGWVALCPAHEDRAASLSVAEGRDGRALVHCFAGCGIDAILSALGLEARDLFADGPSSRPARTMPPKAKAPKAKAQKDKKKKRRGPWTEWVELRRHIYRDENGKHLYRKTKYRLPDGESQWIREKGAESSIYGLENIALAKDNILYISESERDADALMARGDVVAVSPGGAKAWRDEFVAPIIAAEPRRIVVLPHNDDPGRAFAEMVQAALNPEVLTSIRDVSHEGAPKGYDVAAWLEAGGDIDELLTFCQPCGDLGKRLRNPAKAGMSHLSPIENPIEASATFEHRCSSPRWVGMFAPSLRHLRSIGGRCGICLNCKAFARTQRESRLFTGMSSWDRVEWVMCADLAAYKALKKRLERMRADSGQVLAHVSIPYPEGARLVFTEAEVGGEVLDLAGDALKTRITKGLSGAADTKGARVDGSKNWRKSEAKAGKARGPSIWFKVGEGKKNPEEQAEIYKRFGVLQVATTKNQRFISWDVSALSDIELQQLWWALGWNREDQIFVMPEEWRMAA